MPTLSYVAADLDPIIGAVTSDDDRSRRIALLDDVATLRRAMNPALSPYLCGAVNWIIDGKLSEIRTLDAHSSSRGG